MDFRIIKPLRLEAVTLRGIKSYLHGQRIEIRPLTLLCGTNGSGKSTWLNVLGLIHECLPRLYVPHSQEEGRVSLFPFWLMGLKPEQEQSIKGLGNAYIMSAREDASHHDDSWGGKEKLLALSSVQEDQEFGPIGTIGIHAKAAITWDFDQAVSEVLLRAGLPPRVPWVADGSLGNLDPLLQMLWRGLVQEGTQLCIRMTLPETSASGEGIFELTIDNRVLARLRKRRHPDRVNGAYDALVLSDALPVATRDLLAASAEDGGMLRLGGIMVDDSGEHLEIEALTGSGSPIGDQACGAACARIFGGIRVILQEVFDALFFLGAIRSPEEDEEASRSYRRLAASVLADPRPLAGDLTALRCAKTDGSRTHDVEALFSNFRMVQGAPPFRRFLVDGANRLTSESAPQTIMDLRRILNVGADEALEAYLFETFYGVWMDYLVDVYPTVMGTDTDSFRHEWAAKDVKPNGFILDRVRLSELKEEAPFMVPPSTIDRYFHPCLRNSGWNLRPSRLSSGFNQLAPIVVQAGVMFRNEMLGVENPEVHLHPSLQARVCEFFINEARCGKHFLIETHSDLLVYRLIRALLEETLPQEAIRIYFVRLEGDEPAFSKLQQIRVDEQGRIVNWPPGFLDEQCAEARRLLDIMYANCCEEKGEQS